MIALSLFNGFGGLALTLDMMNIKVDKIYSSEIDKYANQAAQALYPDTIQLGDITKWREWDVDFSKIDLLTAGFPCQAWSMAGKMEGDNDPRGALVHDLIDIWTEVKKQNPNVKFMFENVKMKKEFVDYIDNLFTVDSELLNSDFFSGQDRKRNYWSNIAPSKKGAITGMIASDVIDHSVQKPNSEGWQKWWVKNGEFQLKKKYSCILNDVKKSITLTARQVSSWNGCLVRNKDSTLRFLTPREAARLQGMPEHKIDILLNCGLSNTQLYKMIGNGWQLDTIKHIFKGLL